jgi:hypothetical protein
MHAPVRAILLDRLFAKRRKAIECARRITRVGGDAARGGAVRRAIRNRRRGVVPMEAWL